MSKIIASHIDRWYGGEKQDVQLDNRKFLLSFRQGIETTKVTFKCTAFPFK